MPYHTDLTPAWTRRFVRGALITAYLCLLLAGVASIVAPPPSMGTSTSHHVTVAWGVYLVVGALLCLVGSVVRRPGWEFLGSAPLATGWGIYGAVLLVRQQEIPGLAGPGTVVAWGLLALCCVLFYRHGVLWATASKWRRAAAGR